MAEGAQWSAWARGLLGAPEGADWIEASDAGHGLYRAVWLVEGRIGACVYVAPAPEALGARACLIGRSYVWGLGAGGQAGVAKAIDILKNELSVTMALTGVGNIASIDGRVLEGGAAKNQAARVAKTAKPKAAPKAKAGA